MVDFFPLMNPEEATVSSPFLNSLEMPFVPVPRFKTLFCVWPTRRKDFAAFSEKSGTPLPEHPPGSTGDHPVVNVTWAEAVAFCEWLNRESPAPEGWAYRLPGDLEWSAAVGLPHEDGNHPCERNAQADGYPWGAAWPPPKGAGNYSQELGVDDFEFTSPVGTFAANALGIYDLGGNVWEWCLDFHDRSKECRTLRGASWFNGAPDRLKSSFRNDLGFPEARYSSFGFRVVLAPAGT